ncbi:hypothetical protein [Micromonospora pisi]|uniref:hypothetical protein n=1 Tax=Micromonospora pisi TaxID=589240 RepID=UPI0011C34A79|nr:hypothetical protein [Micromonospora pisi]
MSICFKCAVIAALPFDNYHLRSNKGDVIIGQCLSGFVEYFEVHMRQTGPVGTGKRRRIDTEPASIFLIPEKTPLLLLISRAPTPTNS